MYLGNMSRLNEDQEFMLQIFLLRWLFPRHLSKENSFKQDIMAVLKILFKIQFRKRTPM